MSVSLWLTRVDDVALNDTIFYEILDYFTAEEQEYIRKYVFPEDQRRSLLGKLLQYALISSNFHCANTREFSIKKTKENKPYASFKSTSMMLTKPYWNYNLSHHGNFVGIVADDNYIVGLDIVDVTTRTVGVTSASSYVDIFTSQLTPFEKRVILAEHTDDAKYEQFFLYWCLKESYIKAIGLGLGFDLLRVEFTVHKDVNKDRMTSEGVWLEGFAKARIDGIERADWSFQFRSLDRCHVAAVARGPLKDSTASYVNDAWAGRLPRTAAPMPSHDVKMQVLVKSLEELVETMGRQIPAEMSENHAEVFCSVL